MHTCQMFIMKPNQLSNDSLKQNIVKNLNKICSITNINN